MSNIESINKALMLCRARAALCSVPFAPVIPAEDAMLRVIASRDAAGSAWAERARAELPWPWVRNRVEAWYGMRRECRRLKRLPAGVPARFPGAGRWTGF